MKRLQMFCACLLCAAVLLVQPLSALCVPVVDPGEKVYDLSASMETAQAETLRTEAGELVDQYDMDILLLFTSDLEEQNIFHYADSFYEENGFGLGGGRDGVLLVVETEENRIYIAAYGDGERYFGEDYLSYVRENLSSPLEKGNFYGVGSLFLTYARTRIESGRANPGILTQPEIREEEAAGSGSSPAVSIRGLRGTQVDLLGLAWKAAIFAVIVSLVVALLLIGRQKSAISQVSGRSNAYLQGEMNVTGRQDVFLRTKTTRAAIPKGDGGYEDGKKGEAPAKK